MTSRAPAHRTLEFPALLLLFFFSGAASLVYQILWLRMLIRVFGSTTLAVASLDSARGNLRALVVHAESAADHLEPEAGEPAPASRAASPRRSGARARSGDKPWASGPRQRARATVRRSASTAYEV